LEKWSRARDEKMAPGGGDVFARFLEGLDVRWRCSPEDMARIPRSGPVVVVANHPFGLVEGMTLGALLGQVRTDAKFLANSMLAGIPGTQEYLIPVDPLGGAPRANWRGLRRSIEWLEQGGLLVTFPAGEVAALKLPHMRIAEPEWNDCIARLIRLTAASAVPVFFHGVNSAAFHLAGLIHPRLRTALLPHELLNKKGYTIRVAIGGPVHAESLSRLASDHEAMDYLRQRTYLLQSRAAGAAQSAGFQMGPLHIDPPRAKIAAAVDPQALREEAANLAAEHVLLESGDYRVCCARAEEIPNTLREIGRLREIAFRKAGEGSGRSLDLDRFDKHYLHLWVSHRETAEVSGAYRLVCTDTVESPSDLYTSTLFRFRPPLLERLSPAVELGRSFVRPEHQTRKGCGPHHQSDEELSRAALRFARDPQKRHLALLLLWKGIGRWVARHPRYRVLFGPVSISREYSRASKALMVSYLEARRGELACQVAPRRQFRAGRLRGCDAGLLAPLLRNLEELSEVVAELEADGKGIPVLLRQYLQLGGTVLAFNVDRAFSNVVDGLVVVDLAGLAPAVLEKYLGREGAAGFRAVHQL
jgi:putative hemolysin